MLSRSSAGLLPVFRHRSTGFSLVLPPLSRLTCQTTPTNPTLVTLRRPFSASRSRAIDSATKEASYATPILPLPRSIATSSALALVHISHHPSTWPSHLELESRFFFEATQKFKGLGVRLLGCHDTQEPDHNAPHWGKQGQEEVYRMTVHDANGRVLDIKGCSIRTMSEPGFKVKLKQFLDGASSPTQEADSAKQILVCTHGARDCRCSDIGGDLLQALRQDIAQRGLQNEVRLGEVSHLGGHKFAANAILFPSLNILSNLRPEHAPAVISHVLDPQSSSSMWSHYKGSFGLTGEAQEALWTKSQEKPLPTESNGLLAAGKREKVQVKFSTYDGRVAVVDALVGESLMEVAKREELGAVEGTCGGCLGGSTPDMSSVKTKANTVWIECATCQVYLPAKSADPSTIDHLNLPEVSENEDDMLGYAIGFDEDRSRLGCQIRIDKALSEWSLQSEKGVGLPRY